VRKRKSKKLIETPNTRNVTPTLFRGLGQGKEIKRGGHFVKEKKERTVGKSQGKFGSGSG